MTRKLPLFSALLFLGLTVPRLEAQAPLPSALGQLEVIAPNGANKEKHLPSIGGVVPLLMVRPNQVVPVTLQFPADKSGTPVAVTPLDGGQLIGGNLKVLPTGKTIFTFKPGAVPGRYRVMVRTPLEEHLLEFYVVDPAHHPRQQPRGNGQ